VAEIIMFPTIDDNDPPLVECKICSDVKYYRNISTNFNVNKYPSLSLIQQNIRSYNRNIDEFLVTLQGLNVEFDLIILTEAWLGNKDSDLLNIDGYNLFRTYNNLNSSDGLVVYANCSLSVHCRQLSIGGVATALSVNFDWKGIPCEILAVYRSPNSNLNTFIEGLSTYYNNADSSVAKLRILAGDTNCDILNTPPNSLQERYLDVLYDAGFISCLDKVTRLDSNTCIDHYFVKSLQQIDVKSIILQNSITDHFTICLHIIHSNKGNPSPNRETTTDKKNWINIYNSLSTQNWTHVTGTQDINLSVNNFISTISQIIQDNTFKIPINAKTTKIKPWITAGLVNSIRYRDKLRKQLIRQPFNNNLRNRYIRFRNKLQYLLKYAKNNYYKQKITEAQGNPRKFWSVVNEVAGRPNRKEAFPVELFCGSSNGVTTDRKEIENIAQNFNNYFASVGQRLAEAIDPVDDFDEEVNLTTRSEFVLRPVSHQELIKIIMSIRGASAPGWDSIPAKLIKDNIDTLINPVIHIINLSIRTGKFPDAFKVAKVIPIHKSDSKDSILNYRPISLLTIIAKILDKCVKIQLSSYLEHNQIIDEIQYGFRPNKNTSDALFDVTKFVTQQIGLKKRVLLSFLDLAKAFDSVDRNKLIEKLKKIGVIDKSLDWFKSYLMNRVQKVSINGVDSSMESVDYGVVQGSNLGPLLFTVYVNDISKLELKGKLFLFADDMALITEGSTWDEVYSKASTDLIKIKKWLNRNVLSLNVSKTKCLPIFTRRDADPGGRELRLHVCGGPQSLACNCAVIERVEEYKYLGVILNSKFNWVPQIQQLKTRIRRFLYAFGQMGRVMTVAQCRSVYCAYVQSLLEYGILAWGGSASTILKPLAVSQKAIMKKILKKSVRYPTHILFQDFPVLNIKQLYVKNLAIYIFKNRNMFTNIEHNYQTRNRLRLGIQIPRLNHSLDTTNSFYLAHLLYRSLPWDILQTEGTSIAVFKRRMRVWLLGIGHVACEELIKSPYS
jgi:hypothetical protein